MNSENEVFMDFPNDFGTILGLIDSAEILRTKLLLTGACKIDATIWASYNDFSLPYEE